MFNTVQTHNNKSAMIINLTINNLHTHYMVIALLSHPARMLMMTVQPTRKGASGVFVLPLTATSSTTMVTKQVIATSPKIAPDSWLSDLRISNAAPVALMYLSAGVIICQM